MMVCWMTNWMGTWPAGTALGASASMRVELGAASWTHVWIPLDSQHRPGVPASRLGGLIAAH